MKITVILLTVLAAFGCSSRANTARQSQDDFDLITIVLGPADSNTQADRYLTPTRFDDWPKGQWSDFPDNVYQRLAAIGIVYRHASEARIDDAGTVFDRTTGHRGAMHWINLTHRPDGTVEVDHGAWSCDLGGGGGTAIYEMVNGKWQIKSLGTFWDS